MGKEAIESIFTIGFYIILGLVIIGFIEKPVEEKEIKFLATTIVKRVKEYRERKKLIPMLDEHYRFNHPLFNRIRKELKP